MYWLVHNQHPDIEQAYREINNPANYAAEDIHFWDGKWYVRDKKNDRRRTSRKKTE